MIIICQGKPWCEQNNPSAEYMDACGFCERQDLDGDEWIIEKPVEQ